MDLSYEVYSSRELKSPIPVIFLHGLMGSKVEWDFLSTQISKRCGRTVYTIDARNHGNSPSKNEFDYSVLQEDVKHFMTSKTIKEAVIIGHSMGGRTAMNIAFNSPSLVHKLVVIDVVPMILDENRNFIKEFFKSIENVMQSTKEGMSLIEAREKAQKIFSSTTPFLESQRLLAQNLVQNPDGRIRWRSNLSVLTEVYKGKHLEMNFIGCHYLKPTLLLRGGSSNFIPQSIYPKLYEIFPKAKIITVPDASHWVHVDKPEEVLQALVDFI